MEFNYVIKNEKDILKVTKDWLTDVGGANVVESSTLDFNTSIKSFTVSVGLVRSMVDGLRQRSKFLEYSDFKTATDSVTAIANLSVDTDSFKPLRNADGTLDKTSSDFGKATTDLITKAFSIKVEVGYDDLFDLTDVEGKALLDIKLLNAVEKGMVGKAIYSNISSANSHLKSFNGVLVTVDSANILFGIDGKTSTADFDGTNVVEAFEALENVESIEDYVADDSEKVFYVSNKTYNALKKAYKNGTNDFIGYDVHNGKTLVYNGIEVVPIKEIGSKINNVVQDDVIIYGARKAVAIRVHGRDFKLQNIEIIEGVQTGGVVKFGAIAGTPDALAIAYLGKGAD